MEDHYDQEFDRLFARDLKAAGQDAQPRPGEWQVLSSRLDADGRRKRWPILLPWLLLAAMGISNGWMLMQWRALYEEVAHWSQQPKAVAQSVPLPPEHRATIVYDTAYRTVVVTRRVVEERLSGPENYPSGRHPLTNSETAASQTGQGASAGGKQYPVEQKTGKNQVANAPTDTPNITDNQLIAAKNNAKDPANRPVSASAHPSPDSFSQVTGDTLRNSAFAAKSVDTIARQPSTTTRLDSLLTETSPSTPLIKRQRTPVRWRIGAGIGLVGLLGDFDLNFSRSLNASLSGEILLGRHWALAPGMSYLHYNYQMSRLFNPRLLINAPMPPSYEYQLRHIEGDMTHVAASLALRYRFWPDQQWAWYLGAGYAARFTTACRAEYEFDRRNTGEGFRYASRPKVPDRVYLGLTQAGIEYAVHPRWTVFAEGSGLFDFGPGQRTFPLLVTQVGIKWGMK